MSADVNRTQRDVSGPTVASRRKFLGVAGAAAAGLKPACRSCVHWLVASTEPDLQETEPASTKAADSEPETHQHSGVHVRSFTTHNHTPRPTCVAAATSSQVVTCDDKGQVLRWDLPITANAKPFKKLRRAKASFVTVSGTPATGNAVVLTANFTGTVSVSDLGTLGLLRTFDDHLAATGPQTEVWCVAVTISGQDIFAVSGTNAGDLRFWDVNTAETLAVPDTQSEEPLASLTFLSLQSGTSPRFLAGYGDGTMILWEYSVANQTLTQIQLFTQGNPTTINSIAVFTWNGNTQAITGSFDSIVRFWSINPPQATPLKVTLPVHTHFVWRVAAFPDGSKFASVSEDHTAHFFHYDGTPLKDSNGQDVVCPPIPNGIMGVCFPATDTVVVTSDQTTPTVANPEIVVLKCKA